MSTANDQPHDFGEGAAAAEGAIQFAYDLQPPGDRVLPREPLAALLAWRTLLHRLGLIGQVGDRYDGLGFGNLSFRDPEHPDEFIITASQTSGAEHLDHADLVRIRACNLERFWVEAEGLQPPSSETLTHAMLYAADPRIRWVFHGHSPEIWQAASALRLHATAPEVPYGSPAMAAAVAGLLHQHHSRPLAFVTRGHLDGVFCCGPAARDTAGLLVRLYADALAVQHADV